MQEEMKDCGAACLLTIIKTYGGSVSLQYLRQLTNTTKNGTNAYYIIEAAKNLGFNTRAVSGKAKDIDKKFLPCIAHVIVESKYKHFVVIHKIDKNNILIADPALGLRKLKIQEFNKISTNQFLLFTPNKKIPIIKNEDEFFKLCFSNIIKYKGAVICIFIFSLVYTIINIITSYSFQIIIEDVINVFSFKNLYFIVIILFLFIMLKNLVDYFRVELLNYINSKLDFILMNNTFSHIILFPYQYYKNRTTADIISRINDLSNVKESFSNFFMYLFVDSILVVFILINLIRINLSLSLISILIVILYLLTIKLFNSQLEKNILTAKELTSKVNLNLIESLESFETIKGLNLEEKFKNKFSDIYYKYVAFNNRFNKLFNKENLIKNLIDGIGVSTIMVVGAYLVLKDKMAVGELITYNALVVYFLQPLKNIINSDIQIKEVKSSIKRIIDIYSIEKEKLSLDNKYINKKISGDISIKSLSYSYNGLDKIIDSIDLDIIKGEKVLLCGNSGSGKSTLAKILMRYFEVKNNIIMIDNKDLNDYSLLEIRRDICYVSQNEKLFTDSVYNNIVLDRDVQYDYFLSMCKLLKVDEIVNSNICKYDMLLEENGFNISGGERQKIIMARSIIKESSIYIFDESLSQLDIRSERTILENIFKAFKDKTIIVISHRFDNNDLFDKYYTIKEGKIYDGCVRA